jgi:sugar phosphate permease
MSASNIRFQVIAVSMLMAFMLYLDRICVSEIVNSDSFKTDFNASKEELGRVFGAFFFTYALLQIPAGWASDRFGARKMLTIYILLWSMMTLLMGFAASLTGIMFARLAFGVAQAGAYPTSGGVIRRWFPLHRRGIASACVSFGGRLGGTLAPFVTMFLILQLGNWRTVLMTYAILGIVVAFLYWWVVRDKPALHPNVNEGEREFIGIPADDGKPKVNEILPMLWACSRSRCLWLNSLVQFCVNVGWSFLINWLAGYIKESGEVTDSTRAIMVSFVLACGLPGQLFGGWASDRSVAKFGLRWGRSIPLASATAFAGIAYMLCPMFSSVWLVVGCCAIVSFMTDVGNPSTWAFIQDVGGKNTASIYGWANMWGNLGAAFSSVMVPLLSKWGQAMGNEELLVFAAMSSAFFIASFAALGMNATQRVQK